jgi:peptidoglycan/LPS O-acetylase OafA/YrhL
MSSFLKQVDYFLLFRFVACLLVIRQHVGFITPNIPFGFLLGGTPGSGGYAVVGFFLLSGYLLSKGFVSGKYTFDVAGIIAYYFSRAKRILPLYYFVTIFTVFFIFPYLITPNQSYYLPYLVKILTLNYYGGLPYFNQVYWTITVECLFYAILPLLGWFILRKMSLWKAGIVFIFSILLLYFKPNFGVFHSVFADFFGVFVAGLALSLVPNYSNNLQSGFVKILRYFGLFIAILALIMPWDYFLMKFAIKDTLFFTNLSITCMVGFFIFITEWTGGSKVKTEDRSISANRMNYLGELSYGIYLIHILILSQFNNIFGEWLSIHFHGLRSGYLTLLLVSIFCIIIAHFLRYSIEIPGNIKLGYIEKKVRGNFFK